MLAALLLAQSGPLSEAQVLAKLRPVPIFIPGNERGDPLTTQIEGKTILTAFLGRMEGNLYLEPIRKRAGFERARLWPTSLGDLVRDLPNSLAMVPFERQKAKALAFAQRENKDLKEFAGVPLFYLEEAKGGYVTMVEGQVTVIPLYFDANQAEALLAQLQKTEANLKEAKVKVTSLDRVLGILRTAPSSQTRPIQFVPAREALDDYKLLGGR